MQLVIDIGNTFEKLAVYDGFQQRYFKKVVTIDEALIQDIFSIYPIQKSILCSTKQMDELMVKTLKKLAPLTILDHTIFVPVKVLYETPETLGKDRLAAVVGAHFIFPHTNCIIISAGTCITVDVLDEIGNYHGGNIHPGLSMRLKAMHHFTQKLPLLEKAYHQDIIGKSTAHAMQNGAIRGAIWEISSFIEGLEAKFRNSNIIITGGDAKIFEDHMNFRIFALPNLILTGLNVILLSQDSLNSNKTGH